MCEIFSHTHTRELLPRTVINLRAYLLAMMTLTSVSSWASYSLATPRPRGTLLTFGSWITPWTSRTPLTCQNATIFRSDLNRRKQCQNCSSLALSYLLVLWNLNGPEIQEVLGGPLLPYDLVTQEGQFGRGLLCRIKCCLEGPDSQEDLKTQLKLSVVDRYPLLNNNDE